MSTIHFRPDYVKFNFTIPDQTIHQFMETFHTASHERKYSTEWLKSHKVNRLWFDASSGMSTWSVDIWGEWAGIVDLLPNAFFHHIKRFDVRAVVWDATDDTIVNIGQHLQRTITSTNINVYSTRPATKRMGRDRGGKGFAIGSHKSDMRNTVYKRTGEPAAQEFQVTGALLARMAASVWSRLGSTAEVRSLWTALAQIIRDEGTKRMARVFEKAELGTYWPLIGPARIPDLPPIQAQFIAGLADEYDAPLADDAEGSQELPED